MHVYLMITTVNLQLNLILGITVYMEIFVPVLFFSLSPSSAGEVKTGRIQMPQIISLEAQLCLGEIKTGQNLFEVKKCENNIGR